MGVSQCAIIAIIFFKYIPIWWHQEWSPPSFRCCLFGTEVDYFRFLFCKFWSKFLLLFCIPVVPTRAVNFLLLLVCTEFWFAHKIHTLQSNPTRAENLSKFQNPKSCEEDLFMEDLSMEDIFVATKESK